MPGNNKRVEEEAELMKMLRQNLLLACLALLVTTLLVVLPILTGPSSRAGKPLSARATNPEGLRALYLLMRKLGYPATIYMRSTALIPAGSKVVVPFSEISEGEDTTGYSLDKINQLLQRGVDVVIIGELNLTATSLSNPNNPIGKSGLPKNAIKNIPLMDKASASAPMAPREKWMYSFFPGSRNYCGYSEKPLIKTPGALGNNQQEEQDKLEGERTYEGPSAAKIHELFWNLDESGGLHIFPERGRGVFQNVHELHTKGFNFDRAVTWNSMIERLGKFSEVYILSGTKIPVYATRLSQSGNLSVVFLADILTNKEIGLADNVIFAFNAIRPRGSGEGLYFLETVRGFYLSQTGATSLLFLTRYGRVLLALLGIILISVLPRVFPLGKHFTIREGKFPPEIEKVTALGNFLRKQKLLKDAFLFAIYTTFNVNLNLEAHDDASLALFFTQNGVETNLAQKTARALLSKDELTESEKRILLTTYAVLKRNLKLRRMP